MHNNNELKPLNIKSLLTKDNYIIPLYQRNYAWTHVEIIQLLQDILDKFYDSKYSNYYIGTLVVDKRENGAFEIIDGQQRYTTLTLIDAVIKNLLKNSKAGYEKNQSNLNFEARKEVADFIEELFSNYENAKNKRTDHIGLNNIIKAVKDIEIFFNSEDIKKRQRDYTKFIYNNVKIILIDTPCETDVTHYFEIMNNRGEQLESHEILKAKFIESISTPNEISESLYEDFQNYAVPYTCTIFPRLICNQYSYYECLRKEFNVIWEACSQMDKHIQTCFKPDKRKEIFGDDYIKILKDYLSDFLRKPLKNMDSSNTETSSSSASTLEDILKNPKVEDNPKSDSISEDRFKSIIDFPNFLLQVLKIQNKDVSLDDKKFLDEFGYTNKKRTLPDAIEFANSLLYYRTLFDKYIIKREEGGDNLSWSLKQPTNESDNKIGYRNTKFGNEDDSDSENSMNKDICMIQSMLHVSFPGNIHKEWLQDVLLFFKEKTDSSIIYKDFRNKLKEISKKFYDKYSTNGLNRGTGTERFIFNYLDYILWRKYIDEFKGKEKTITDSDSLLGRIASNKEKFNSFQFRQNNSVEHLHPQSKVDELEEDKMESDYNDKNKILNNFGNLCLISRDSNSKYNDYGFKAKKEQFPKRKYVESLKQAVMFSYNVWNTQKIKEHAKEMTNTIETYHNCKLT